MIIEYGGRNCWAFREWLNIDFSVKKNVPKGIGFSDVNIIPAMCFEGANASGKSSALRVLSFIMDFCRNSFLLPQGSNIYFETFFNNEEPSDFYIKFSIPGKIEEVYLYELKLTTKKILSETIYTFEGKKKIILLKRKNNKIILNNFLETVDDRIILKDNSSFISTFIQYGLPEMRKFIPFFDNFISNVSYNSTIDENLIDHVANYYYHNPNLHKKVIEILKKFDTGIEDVEIISGTDSKGKEMFLSKFKHITNAENPYLGYFNQSTGTKLLYNRLKDFIMIVNNGGILVYDEISNHLHSKIVPILYRYFLNEDINSKHSQIIYTSHDASLMDDMKKYRTYLFNKEEGESYCYRIDEIPNNVGFRNDRSLENIYKTGLLGGVPNV